MLHYPKEYEEAISRLNAPERSPLPYAPLPYGPVPNKCNYMNWNRIMAETRQGVLPKYSILQRIDLSSQNDLVMVSDAKEYTYTLDPSFTFAKGARKSIAVRAVDIYNVIPIGQSIVSEEMFEHGICLKYTSNLATYAVNIMFDTISFEMSNDLEISMNNFAKAFGKMVYSKINDTANGKGLLSPLWIASYFPTERRISVDFPVIPTKYNQYTFTSIDTDVSDVVGSTDIYPYWIAGASTAADCYNLDATKKEQVYRAILSKIADNGKSFTLSFELPKGALDKIGRAHV